ncbi:MAG: hypothetical protein RSH79_07280 [Clostridiales bacterium]
MTKRLFIDMDGTIANFQDRIVDDDGCFQIELMYQPDFFKTLKPFDKVIEGIRQTIRDNSDLEVYIISAAEPGEPPSFILQKNKWLDEFFPEIDQAHRIFPLPGENKAKYIPEGISCNDYILDDYNVNLQEFKNAGGNSIKCINHVNGKGLGAYGGDIGNHWHGATIKYNDNPKTTAYVLKLHMAAAVNAAEKAKENCTEKANIPYSLDEDEMEI